MTPSLTVNGRPPIRLAITGMPEAIASTDVRLKPSWAIVGTRQMSADGSGAAGPPASTSRPSA